MTLQLLRFQERQYVMQRYGVIGLYYAGKLAVAQLHLDIDGQCSLTFPALGLPFMDVQNVAHAYESANNVWRVWVQANVLEKDRDVL